MARTPKVMLFQKAFHQWIASSAKSQGINMACYNNAHFALPLLEHPLHNILNFPMPIGVHTRKIVKLNLEYIKFTGYGLVSSY